MCFFSHEIAKKYIMYKMNNSCYKLFMKKYDKTNFDSNCQLNTYEIEKKINTMLGICGNFNFKSI